MTMALLYIFKVTISASGADIFRGFFVQARDSSGTPVGTFEASAVVQVIDCLRGTQVRAHEMSTCVIHQL